MYQQSQIDHRQIVRKGVLSSTKDRCCPRNGARTCAEKRFQISGTTMRALPMKRAKRRSILLIFGLAETALTQGFGHTLHHGAPRQADAQHRDRQRFLLMSMDSSQEVLQLLMPGSSRVHWMYPSRSSCSQMFVFCLVRRSHVLFFTSLSSMRYVFLSSYPLRKKCLGGSQITPTINEAFTSPKGSNRGSEYPRQPYSSQKGKGSTKLVIKVVTTSCG